MVSRWMGYRADGMDWRHVAEFATDHRVYSAHGLKRLAASAGWEVRNVHAGYETEPMAEWFADTNRLLLVATKAQPFPFLDATGVVLFTPRCLRVDSPENLHAARDR